MNTFFQKIEKKWAKGNFLSVGLDSDYQKIPSFFKENTATANTIISFNKAIVDATHLFVCCYKANSAFYEAKGSAGVEALKKTMSYIHKIYPDIPVIIDAKRADIGNTNFGYVDALFDYLGADATTIQPYLGKEAIQPFLDRQEKGVFILVKTSNPGAGEFQDLLVGDKKEKLYQVVARHIANDWNGNKNCGIVVGATHPEELAKVREIVGDMPILIPGIGAQGGDIEAVVRWGKDSRGMGMIINSSRDIIFSSDDKNTFSKTVAKKAEAVRNTIRNYL